MTSINDTFINALLADSSYVDGLTPGLTGDTLRLKLTGRMTPELAKHIGDNFTVVNQVGGLASSFDATVWRGNAGTSYAGQVYVSMRGTQEGPDFTADADLASRLALKTLLSTAGYAVDGAASAAEATARLDAAEYQLVLADLRAESEDAGPLLLAFARQKEYRPATALISSQLRSNEGCKPAASATESMVTISDATVSHLLAGVADLIGNRADRRMQQQALRRAS